MHVEKFTRSAVGHMLQHYSRTASNMSNEEIDVERTRFNYNLCQRDMTDFAYYKQRLAQVKCQNRSDVKTLCSWIITLPKRNFTAKGEEVFFQTAYKELCRRYKEENVISAWVHKDEKGQPHMHFCFIPITLDKKKNIEKVSAKEVLTRKELSQIHKDMDILMEERFKRNVGILNGATVKVNQSITELKLKTAQATLDDVKQEIPALAQLKKQTVNELAETIKQKPELISSISTAMKIALGEQTASQEINRNIERSR